MTHVLCKMLNSRARFIDTLSISLQLVAVLYVVSVFATLIIHSLSSKSIHEQIFLFFVGSSPIQFSNKPIDIYLLTYLVFASIYLPLALKNVHQFNLQQTLLIFFLSLVIARIPTLILSKMLYNAIEMLGRIIPLLGGANSCCR